MWQTSAIANAI